MGFYVVHDGRALSDVDGACILDYIGEVAKERAVEEFKNTWINHDAVLFEYDADGDNLVNGRNVSM